MSVKDMIWLQNNYYYDLFYKKKKKIFLDVTKKFWKKINILKIIGKMLKEKISSFSEDIVDIISKDLSISKNKIYKIDHHTCHANYAYHSSPFVNEKCLVFTMDGSGDGLNASISVGDKGKLKRIYGTSDCIVGRIYSHITLLLGMREIGT